MKPDFFINLIFIIGALCGVYALTNYLELESFIDHITVSILVVGTIINLKSIKL